MSEDNTFDELSYLRNEVKRLRHSLNVLTPRLGVILKRRGFPVYKKEPRDDLLVPAEKFLDDYYGMLRRYSFRLFLRDVIKHQNFFTLDKVTRYATSGVTGEYIEYVRRLGLTKKLDSGFALGRHIRSFGETLEWFVAEVFKREFGAEAMWGVKFKRPNIGGDYDVIAKLDGSLVYAEVKSSPPKQIYDSEISAFLDRTTDLAPEISIFFMDTELRMKDKIVPMFEEELKKKTSSPPEVMRIEKELFQIKDRIFIINSKDSIVRNLETALNWYLRR